MSARLASEYNKIGVDSEFVPVIWKRRRAVGR